MRKLSTVGKTSSDKSLMRISAAAAAAGVSKQIFTIAPGNFREPLTVARTVMGLIAILITVIQLIPDIINLLR